jgi:uncharacterized protein (DUF2141 family)
MLKKTLTGLILIIILLFSQKEAEAQQANLKIWIKGFRNTKGTVFAGLYNKPQGFATETAYRGVSYEITGTEMWVTFDSIPKGSYAVAIIHDENSNKKLDQGEIGIPVEGYGFSNDARGLFGPPDFRLAMFYFSASADKTIVVNLLYPKKMQ